MRNLSSIFGRDGVRGVFPVLVLAGALGAQTAYAAGKVVTDADNGGEVHLKMSDTLTVRLGSNPSTGYMWYVSAKSTPLLKLVRQTEIEATGPTGRPPDTGPSAPQQLGRPMFQVFEFEPRRSGEGVLLLHYVRSWEKPAPDEEQFELRVSIE